MANEQLPIGDAVLTFKTAGVDAFLSSIGRVKSEGSSTLKKSFDDAKKSTLDLGKDGTASLSSLADAFKDPIGAATTFGTTMAEGVVGGLSATVVAAAAAVGAIVAVGAACVTAAFDAAEVGAALDDASEITGISVEKLSGYKFAMEATGGTLEQFTNSVFMLQKRMEQNPQEFEQGLKRIGLTAQDLEDLDLDEKFLAINRAFREVGPGADQAAAAIALFGKQGRDMIPLLNEDIAGLVATSKDLGLEWSGTDAKAAEDLKRASAELHQVWSGLWTGIGNFFIPALHSIVSSGVKVVASFNEMRETVRLLWGDVRNIPKEIKEPKMWRDLADRGVKPVALSMSEADAVIREMNESLKVQQQRVKEQNEVLAKGEKERKAFLESVRAANVELSNWNRTIVATAPSLSGLTATFVLFGDTVEGFINNEGHDLSLLLTEGLIGPADLFGNTLKGNTIPAIDKVTFSMEDATEESSTWHSELDQLSQSFANLGAIGGDALGTVARGIGTIIASFSVAIDGIDSFKKGLKSLKAGDTMSGITGIISGIAGIVGAAQAAIGAVKALWNWARGGEEGTQVNPAREKWFAERGGSVESVASRLEEHGIGGEAARVMIQAVFDAKTMAEFTAAIGAFPFRRGGLVTGPTLGMLGEDGPELVVPLDRLNQNGRPLHVHVMLAARELARAIVPHLPDAVGAFT